MEAYTKHELEEMGAKFGEGFEGYLDQVDYVTVNGNTYYHEANDYQAGAGNSEDYKMYRSLRCNIDSTFSG